MLMIKILANFIPILLGMVALISMKKKNLSKRDKLAFLGFAPWRASELLFGLFLGAAAFVFVFTAFRLLGYAEITAFRLPAIASLFTLTLMFLTFAIGEEFVFRSLFFSGLKQFSVPVSAILLISSLFFAFGHILNEGVTYLSTLSAFVGGLMYGLAYIRTGRLWLPMGLHMTWNWVQGIGFGFPVSGETVESFIHLSINGPTWITGGHYGPEGGVIGITARLLIILAILRWPVQNNVEDA